MLSLDFVNRDDVINAIYGCRHITLDEADILTERIKAVPSVPNIGVVAAGVWKRQQLPGWIIYKCSVCGKSSNSTFRYCPECGAAMCGVEE